LAAGAADRIRIGWQVPWAVQGQIVQIWKHTDILKRHGLDAEFVGRTYGPELNEIALAGAVDVVLTADQPAVMLNAKSADWVATARLMYNRTSTYVPLSSPIKTMAGLKGKTIGLPVGAAAERVTLAALKRAGLEKKDVSVVNLGILEQAPLIQAHKDEPKWAQFDALAGFDPAPAIFEAKGLVRVLDVGKVCAMIVMNGKFIEKHAGVADRLNAALIDAYDRYRTNPAEANAWFLEEAKLGNADAKALDIAASLEPNLKAKSRAEIRVGFSEDDVAIVRGAGEFLHKNVVDAFFHCGSLAGVKLASCRR
jgi:ABC-type nitrate/sulfonate/bicarbonate transport system substrate-binding protein